jgi:hypothetical protein
LDDYVEGLLPVWNFSRLGEDAGIKDEAVGDGDDLRTLRCVDVDAAVAPVTPVLQKGPGLPPRRDRPPEVAGEGPYPFIRTA